MFYSPNVVAIAQFQSSFLPPQSQSVLQVMLAPHYNDLEKWIMFVLAYFCIQCHFPFQNHCKIDNMCEPYHVARYKIIAGQNSPISFSNTIPLGISAHNVTPLQSIPQNYIALILFKHSFPLTEFPSAPASRPASQNDSWPISCLSSHSLSSPHPSSYLSAHAALIPPFSNCAVVGVENDKDRYIDVDSGDYDKQLFPPSHSIHQRGSHYSLTLRDMIPIEDNCKEAQIMGTMLIQNLYLVSSTMPPTLISFHGM
ncbi:hypothetical protein EDD85DRAFT_956375 [Armillaria nabsnona]|nr:hypothetical protein EDD85DRAFT_956375 [Armillaria nabsnona]